MMNLDAAAAMNLSTDADMNLKADTDMNLNMDADVNFTENTGRIISAKMAGPAADAECSLKMKLQKTEELLYLSSQEGSDNINSMDKQMNIISLTSAKSYSMVQELNKNVDEINNFLSGITQIAEQTNLLALNAAIEAARAKLKRRRKCLRL
jgi:hypothetical protein